MGRSKQGSKGTEIQGSNGSSRREEDPLAPEREGVRRGLGVVHTPQAQVLLTGLC